MKNDHQNNKEIKDAISKLSAQNKRYTMGIIQALLYTQNTGDTDNRKVRKD